MKLKRRMSFLVALVMLFSVCFSNVAMAQGEDKFITVIEKVVDEVYAMNALGDFLDLAQLFANKEMQEKFLSKVLYEAFFNELSPGQQQRLTASGVSYAIRIAIEEIVDSSYTKEKLNDRNTKEALKTSLINRYLSEKDELSFTDVNVEEVTAFFSKATQMLDFLTIYKNSNNEINTILGINGYLVLEQGNKFVLSNEIDKVFNHSLVKVIVDINNTASVKNALNSVLEELSKLGSAEKVKARTILREYKLLAPASTPTDPSPSDPTPSTPGTSTPGTSTPQAPKTAAEAAKNLQAAAKDLSKLSAAEVEKVATELVKNTAALINTANAVSKAEAAELRQQVLALVERAVAQVSNTKVTAVDGKVEVPANTVKANLEKAKQLKAALEKTMKDNGIAVTKSVPVILTFTVEGVTDTAAVTVPKAVLQETGADVKVQLNTGLASFVFDKDTFDTEDVTLTVKKVEVPGYSNVLDFSVGGVAFKKPVEVIIPFATESEYAAVYRLANGQATVVGGLYDAVAGGVKATLPSFSQYFAKVADKKTFSDIQTNWAKDTITVMASKGYINGTDGKFNPSADITRAEFTALIVRMLKLTDAAELAFEDVSATNWFYNEVAAAYKAGLINGKSATTFDPNGKITRQEMAKIVATVLTQKGYVQGTTADLADVVDQASIAAWAKSEVAAAYREGILTGRPNGAFDPSANATRAEAAVMLYRLFNK